jgi:hypothetical protein
LEAEFFVDDERFDEFFLPVLFLAPLFFEVDEDDFLLALFLLVRFFSLGFGGMLAPLRRASLKPIAIACFGFFTFLWLRPDSSS